jgi:hypothetical protein
MDSDEERYERYGIPSRSAEILRYVLRRYLIRSFAEFILRNEGLRINSGHAQNDKLRG